MSTPLQFSGDELVLALISLVRVVDARMLQQGPEGFTVNFEHLDQKQGPLTGDEVLLMKVRVILERPEPDDQPEEEISGATELLLEDAERRRLAEMLAALEGIQGWSSDVMKLCRGMRERLLEGLPPA